MKRELLIEMARIAIRSIRGNKLRTSLTVGIIGLGIMALISMTTATSSLEANVVNQFSTLGTSVFSISQKTETGVNRGRRVTIGEPISYQEAQDFAANAPSELKVSYSIFGTAQATLTRGKERTNPNIQVLGIEENYLEISGYQLDQGRNFTAQEAASSRRFAILGSDLVSELFNPWEDAVGQEFSIGAQRYQIIGVLESKGQAFGMSQDNQCYIPIPCVRQQFSDEDRSYRISCQVSNPAQIMEMAEAATGIMRVVRKDRPGEDHSFNLSMSNGLVETLKEAISGITIAASIIGIITLFGAGIGLMNIMLVSVSERTREIGTRKSLGASPSAIRMQFLIEVIIIGQLGGATGIVLGLFAGNGIAWAMETPFVLPWKWMLSGVALSLITSLISGYYPARKASLLDPIVALGRE
ncbi:MAG: ABC transporter permease [Flavobacteriales bacterium]